MCTRARVCLLQFLAKIIVYAYVLRTRQAVSICCQVVNIFINGNINPVDCAFVTGGGTRSQCGDLATLNAFIQVGI